MVNVPISAHCSLFCKRSGVIQDLVLKKKNHLNIPTFSSYEM